MERAMTHMGSSGGGGSSGGSVVSREEEQCSNSNMGLSSHEASSYPDESEIELGLGLSLGGGGGGGGGGLRGKMPGPRILTANDLTSMGTLRALKSSPPSAASSSASSLGGGGGGGGEANHHGTKRAAETSPTRISQVVGWPPIRASRMNRVSSQAKTAIGEISSDICSAEKMNKPNPNDNGHVRGSLYVKVNMDGIGIGRKLDLSRHSSYESLAKTLEEMFSIPSRSDTSVSSRGECGVMSKAKRPSKLLDGLSDFVLTYEDKDGDWMLVGDVPWGLFLSSVKRLRIMKRSEANGLNQ